jgi:hypothetical protein
MPKVYIEKEVLEKLEWIADEFSGVTGGMCRICGGYKRNVGLHLGEFVGHKPDCKLGIALSRIASIKDGEPCSHPGCLAHITHPCEGCGRIAGRRVDK